MSTIAIPTSTVSKTLNRMGRAREFGILAALVIVVAAATAKNPAFLFSADG